MHLVSVHVSQDGRIRHVEGGGGEVRTNQLSARPLFFRSNGAKVRSLLEPERVNLGLP
jgi:hypothetical protein